MTALTLRDFVAGYDPDLPIVKDVTLDVPEGQVLTILGPNGAGKSTLIRAVAGMVPIFSGEVRLSGRDVTRAPAHALARAGLGFVPQTENVFTRLSIRENLQIAAELLPRSARAARVAAMLAMFPDLAARPEALAGSLSGGQRQMLAAARALLSEPRVLILDEPSAGLSPKLVAQVFDSLRRIAQGGVTLVLVEQNVRAALALADRAVVLVDGRLAHDAPAAELVGNPLLGQLFLGARAA
ncbi:Branched-chain amino acid transport ATP-binding protein LivF [Rubellimicrobium mesophilum DSM 19309]|uniref:Branched-chain amino acid transport ATP-binding protein LivF n=1 Tax=Rubellimicrobium mesophilum DSM 19309 TaxID=442562 RepID=A0A017HPH6_9RHOB|nr:ABC transporter ATP-binding protein [Rubellimicrobium mesophilum]EYD76028.1 Branched-chain amino acid transport ATP-binding protein LivF [Rubellimicrobium mesophilum DSM 19309]